jgi:hypothetical protein
MSLINLSDEERESIKKQHEEATKKHYDRKNELKKGIQPKKKQEEKPTK